MRGSWVLAAVAVLAIPNALAVQPLDDDAGSGGDAGDLAQLAAAIGPGSYDGTLHATGDWFDHYGFHAEMGELLTLTYDVPFPAELALLGPPRSPEEHAYPAIYLQVREGETARFPVPFGGTWFLRASVFQMPSAVADVAYRFSLGIERPRAFGLAASPTAWEAVELRWDQPADVVFWFSTGAPHDLLAGSAAMQRITVRFAQGWSWSYASGGLQTGFGSGVGAGPIAVELEVQGDEWGGGAWGFTEELPGFVGSIRYAAFHDQGLPLFAWTASALPWQARATGDVLIDWNEETDDATFEHAPGFIWTGGAGFNFTSDGTLMAGLGSGGASGALLGPGGQRFEIRPNSGASYGTLAQGPWTLQLNARMSVGLDAFPARFAGAFIPRLGVA